MINNRLRDLRIDKDLKQHSELLELYKDIKLNYGNIICKCNLIDCVYMTEEFINQEKENNYNNFIAGDYKEGRYAWILDSIEEVEPIPVKGQLGIWNYNK